MAEFELPEQIQQSPAWRARDLVLILLGIALIFAILIFIWYLTDPNLFLRGTERAATATQAILLALIESAALIGGVFFFGMLVRKITWRDLGFTDLSKPWVVATVFLTLALLPLSAFVTWLVTKLLGLPLTNPQLDVLLPEQITWIGAITILVLVGLVVPFAEELFFRGVLFRWLRAHLKFLPASLLSATIFAILHADVAVGVSAFVLGLGMALLYEYSQSLWAAVLLHALNNSIKLGLLYWLFATNSLPSL